MDDTSDPQGKQEDPKERSWLSAVCDGFEAAWSPGGKAEMESFLAFLPEPQRSELRRELEAIDARRRQREQGNMPEQKGDDEQLANPAITVDVPPSSADQPADTPAAEDAVTKVHVPAADDLGNEATALFDSGTQEQDDVTKTFRPHADRGSLRYTVLRPHAKGGLGLVSVARDEELGREVAFKELLDRFADDADVQSRFVLEAEVTGSLEHPGIVPIYGLGRDANKRPFYAMRFIRGDSFRAAITGFHRDDEGGAKLDPSERHLKFRQLLGHFIDACQAMEYAHSRGVIHRDIKPANIMLGQFGETLVVDWGLAKTTRDSDHDTVVARSSTSSGSVPTLMGTVIGTPAYMSPEQASGRHDQVGPASDVYSLGATLFTLLTGKKAFQQEDLVDMLEAVRGGVFPRPRELNPATPAPLESICLKAMAREPAQRYRSCRELAEEIEHWLADEPVKAHPETFLQQASRWSRRHKAWMRAISVALVTVAVVAVVAAIVVDQARRREEVARLETVEHLQKAREAVDTWLTGAGEILEFVPGTDDARLHLLEQAASDYEEMVRQTSDDADLEVERARTYLRLGNVQQQLRKLDEAEASYRTATGVLDRLQGENPDRQDMQVEWANGQTKLGILCAGRDRFDEANTTYTQAEEKLRGVLESNAQNELALAALATNRLNHGFALCESGSSELAVNALNEAVVLFEQLHKRAPSESRHVVGLAKAEGRLGHELVNHGAAEEGLGMLRKALATADSLVDTDKTLSNLRLHAEISLLIASISRSFGDYREETRSYENAIGDYAALQKELPTVAEFAVNLTLTRVDLGQVLHDRGKTEEALAVLDQAEAEFILLSEQHPADGGYLELLATCRAVAGRVLSDLGKDSEAKERLSLALATYQQLALQSGSAGYVERLAVCQSQYGQLLHKLGDHEAARASLEAADRTLVQLIGQDSEKPSYHDERAFVQKNLGAVLWAMGEEAEAKTAFETARKTWEAIIAQAPLPDYCDHLAWFLVNCPVEEFRGSLAALEYAQQAVGAVSKNARYQTTLGAALYRQGEHESAVATLKDAVEIEPSNDGRTRFYLALALLAQGQRDTAGTALTTAVRQMEVSRPGNLEMIALRQEAEARLEASEQKE